MALISAEALAELLQDRSPRPAVLDVRWQFGGPPGREEYRRGHIPGAAFVDLDEELAGPPGAGGRHPLPERDQFAASMRAAGVSDDRPVVVYDAATSMAAARAWWLLVHFGHADVRVLDGGLAAWTGAGYPVEHGESPIPGGNFEAGLGAMPIIDARSSARLARTGVLLDARAPERFRGEQEPIDPVAGHIPGAANVPASETLRASGGFRDREALRARFAQAGVRQGVAVGAYCGSGVTATHAVLALELAGYSAALYPGSWSDWIRDSRRPVARGPEPATTEPGPEPATR